MCVGDAGCLFQLILLGQWLVTRQVAGSTVLRQAGPCSAERLMLLLLCFGAGHPQAVP
jgi:hypothetical protein